MKLKNMMAIFATFAPDGVDGGSAPPTGDATPNPTDTPPASGGEERTFTQAQVNEIIADRMRRVRPVAPPPVAPVAPTKAPAKKTSNDLDARFEEFETRQAFMHSYMDAEIKLNSAQRGVLERDFVANKPENSVDWIKERSAELGFGVAPTPSTNSQEVVTPPANQPGPPPAQRTSENTPLVKMSKEDRAHILQTKGRTYYAKRLREEMRTTKIDLRDEG